MVCLSLLRNICNEKYYMAKSILNLEQITEPKIIERLKGSNFGTYTYSVLKCMISFLQQFSKFQMLMATTFLQNDALT